MKNNLLIKLLAMFLTGTMLIGAGCKDYDDDIKDLSNRIDASNASVDELKALIEAGSVIKSVTTTADGLTFTLSNGESYTITNGVDGTDAVVWTIGSDGYWYKDGNKTEYKAIGVDGQDGKDGEDGQDGQDGKPGEDGQDGQDGEDGKDGDTIYYVPNVETGCFDIWKNGEFSESTTISWKASGVSGIVNGNILTLTIPGTKADGSDAREVEILLGAQLGSVAFVPEVVSSDVPYATTTDEFLHIASYLTESKYDGSKNFLPQDWNKSNEIALVYRMNPTNAYVEGAVMAFINRDVTTRAIAGDESDLLNVVSGTFGKTDGNIDIKASINPMALSTQNNIAALQVWAGQNPVTSDFIHVKSTPIDAVIVDSLEMKKNLEASPIVDFYERTKAISSEGAENDAFVKQFVGAVGAKQYPANFEFAYNGSIDLKELVGLFSAQKKNFLFSLGFTGMSYEFSLPKEYLAADNDKTNQQWFVQLNDGIVEVNKENLTGAYTQAVGRTPIVRVDAYLTDNKGMKQMVASSYIKLSIAATVAPDKDDNNVQIAEDAYKNYRELTANTTTDAINAVAKMSYEDINNKLYGAEGLTSTTFWNAYNKTYNVLLTATGTSGQQIEIFKANGTANTLFDKTAEGVNVKINLNNNNETTSAVEIYTNNKVKTQHTYKNVDEKGAEYTLTITINAKDNKANGNFILTQKFYVLEEHMAYPYNILYHFLKSTINGAYADFEGETQEDIVIVKGQVDASSSTWKMSSVISEHFANSTNSQGQEVNIFGYYLESGIDPDNVASITFDWAETPVQGVTPTDPQPDKDFSIALDGELDVPYLIKDMTYTTTLVNGEDCDFTYSIVFVNPFVAGNASGVTILGNQIGEQNVATAPQVLVNDKFGDAILRWSSNALALTSKATNEYKVAMPSVSYAFDTTEQAYKDLVGNLSEGSTFEVDNMSGEVTWENEGATLAQDYVVTVIATVTFEDLSVVECRIPVTISAKIGK